MYTVVDFGVWVASTFSSKLEDGPILLVFVVEELDQLVGGIAIGFLGPY